MDRRAPGTAPPREFAAAEPMDAAAAARYPGQPMAAGCRPRRAQPRARSLFPRPARTSHQAHSRSRDRLLLPCRLLDELERRQARGELGLSPGLLVSRRDRRLGSCKLANGECGTCSGCRPQRRSGSRDPGGGNTNKPADLSGKSLENLDLSNLGFKRANLAGANLFGAKLVGSDLSGADLSGARLDLAWIMRANFSNADLSNASLLGSRRFLEPGDFARRGADVHRRQFFRRTDHRSPERVRSERGQFHRRQNGRGHEESIHGVDEDRSLGRQFVRCRSLKSGSRSRAAALYQFARSQADSEPTYMAPTFRVPI